MIRLAAFHAQAVVALSNLRADSIVLVDRTGQLVLSTARPFGTPLPAIANPVLLQRILKTGEPGVSDLFLGPIVEKSIYTIAVPIKRDGSITHTLNATVRPARSLSVLTEQELPAGWIASIADSSCSIVARTHEMTKVLGRKVVPDLLNRMRVSREDSFETETLEGIPVLTAYSRSKVTGWTVAIGAPLVEIKGGIRRTLAEMLAVTLIALGIGLALAWFIGGRIAGAFTELVKPARALGSGQAVTVRRLPISEANEVGEALLEAAKLLDQANRAKGDFLASMSHEFRTPLNAILGFAQVMESGSPPPTLSQKKSLDQILKGGWELLELLNEVLNFALIESGNVIQTREPVSLAEVMLECRVMVEPLAKKRGIGLTFPQFETPCFVHADRSSIEQCLINLLSNAIKYNKPNGAIVVGYTLSTPDSIRIIVRDSGAGLTPKQLAQLFQPFNRLGREGDKEKGLGLGLAVTKRLAELMGGTIGADSIVGVGSTFWLELKLTTAPRGAVQDADAPALKLA